MKKFLAFGVAAAAACVMVSLPCPAQEEDLSKYKLSDWNIGDVLFGEKVTRARLKGKAVVIENWGVRCPPCVALLPHLADLDRRHRDKGLVIIGAESQGHGKDAIKPLLDKAKVEYTITSGANGPIEFSAIPRAFVFDADGRLIFSGNPGDSKFDRAVKDALRTVKAGQAASSAAASSGPKMLVASQAWKNSDGREIRAAVKSADENEVVFVLPNGRETRYALDKLSVASREAIVAARDAAAEEDESGEEDEE